MIEHKYELELTSAFKHDYKRAKKRGLDLNLLDDVVTKLQDGEQLPKIYLDHTLKGKWAGHRECHIQPDWLLIYRIVNKTLVLSLVRTGKHNELHLD